MAEEFLYVHLDSNNNSVLSMGISHSFFSHSISNTSLPDNLLLLSKEEENREYDPYTGLHVVRGKNQVKEYLYSKKNDNSRDNSWSWIDYVDLNLLHQVTPSELSELLYFGHTKSALHSPFFYKLQNNFAFFDTRDGLSKIYYRDISVFYNVLANAITSLANKRIVERLTFFKKTATIPQIPGSKIKQIKHLLQEGLVLSFKQRELINGEYTIPLIIVEEKIQTTPEFMEEKKADALLIYNHADSEWKLIL